MVGRNVILLPVAYRYSRVSNGWALAESIRPAISTFVVCNATTSGTIMVRYLKFLSIFPMIIAFGVALAIPTLAKDKIVYQRGPFRVMSCFRGEVLSVSLRSGRASHPRWATSGQRISNTGNPNDTECSLRTIGRKRLQTSAPSHCACNVEDYVRSGLG